MGLVSQVYAEDDIKKLTGHLSVAHNRYSTFGGTTIEHAHPILVNNGKIALVHNGNLPSTALLEDFLKKKSIDPSSMNDSRMMAEAIGVLVKEGRSLEDAVEEAYPLFTGAFCTLVMSDDTLIAIRDERGIRPLEMARLNGGYVFSSETCALATVGAEYVRNVKPGEMVVVDNEGLRAKQIVPGDLKLDIFEFVYFARPDSELLQRSVYEVRRNFGTQLAKEYPIEADVVIPVPETAIPAGIGYSQATGIPLEMGLTKNRYIHRTFIAPEQHIREQGVKAKLTPLPHVIRGKRVVVMDDSIVRGTTSRQIVAMLFEAGAKEVHFLVSSPPVKFPDFYGIDTPKQEVLIAATKSVEQIRQFLKATSLRFLSFNGMITATGRPESDFSTSCFTGVYPIDIRERAKEVRY
jgi:amidophosphoribosyltransferase